MSAFRVGLVLFFSIFSIQASARFSMRLRVPASDGIKRLGATEICRCDAEVNGNSAIITILGFDRPLNEVSSAIRSFLNVSNQIAVIAQTGDAAWMTFTDNNMKTDVFLMPGNSSDQCSAWIVESAIPQHGEAMPDPPGRNPLPDAELKSWILNKTSGTLITVHESQAQPIRLIEAAVVNLAAEGWTSVLLGDSTAILAHDGKMAVVTAHQTPTGICVTVIR